MLGKLGEKIEDYAVYEVLGKGGFGCVYKARCLLTGCFVAIKMLYTFFEDFEHVYLVLELAENGELQQFLRERNMPFSEYEAALILRRVVDGLLYLHTHQILHRDISLSNLLITKDMNIKIADFGLATELMQPDEKHHTLCGTPNYISPEVASRASHGLPADVWGLGCMLYTLLVGKPPFDTDGVKSTLARVVLSNYSLPTHLSSDVSDLIERLLKKNPTERIKLEEVLSHPFLSRYDLGRAKAYVFNSVNQKFPSAADSGMGTISSNSGSKSDLFQVHFSGAAVSNSRCNNRPNENLYHEQFASSNYRYREKQHGAGSIESSYQFVPEPHISLLQKHQNNNTPVALKDPSGANVRLPARFDTLRLLPTRNRTKYVILSIVAESGEVVLEFLKPRGRNQEDRVVDVCRISGDGLRFMLYQPDGSRGVAIKNEPPDLPSRGVDQIYNYEEIPEKHWKKYMYAARFVNMVKAKTPKITLYSEKAKCQLMETMRDYEVMFYDDTKIVQSSANDEIKMVDANGKAYRGLASISAMDAAKLDHFQETHDHCLRIEKLLSTVSHSGKTFPVIIGRRPAGSDSSTPGKKDMSNHRFYSLNVRTT
uniref:Serine/threonine-protein kinase SAK n=1 Tax=Anopheles stephensi TaxID=30069 RepID=A0A182YPS4_ANOST